MARRKKRRKSGGLLSGITGAISGIFKVLLRGVPFLVLTGFLVGLFFGVRHLLYADTHLVVRGVRVEPSDALAPARLSEIETHVLGQNILKVNVKRITADLEKSPAIKSARVSRLIPDVIRIDIETRKPVALVRFAPDGKYGLVAEDGVILNVFDKNTEGLVTIDAFGLGSKFPQIGTRFEHAGFAEAVRFLEAFAAHPLAQRETLTRVALDHLGSLTAVFGEGPPVKLGRQPSARLDTMERMMHLLESADRPKIEYIDLQYDNVIVKRKN